MPRLKFVRTHLKWVDSVGPVRYWEQMKDVDHRTSEINTVGWVIHENKKTVTVASSVSTSGCAGGIITIPKSAIAFREDG